MKMGVVAVIFQNKKMKMKKVVRVIAEIDRNKCGAEYSLCPQCKYENEDDCDKCGSCTMVVDVGYSFLLCGIPVGSGITHLHKNFEPKEKGR